MTDQTSLLSGRSQDPEIPTMLIGDAKKQAQEAVDKKKASLKRATEAYKAAHNGKLPQKEDKDKGGKGGVGTALAIGAAQFNEGVFKIPRYLYELAAVPQNFIAEVSGHPELAADYDAIAQGKVNPLGIIDRLGDWANESGEQMQAQMPKYDKGVFDSLKDGNYGVAGEQVLNNIAQSVPSIIGMYVTGGAGNAAKLGGVAKTFVTALPFSSQKNAELQERTDIPDYIKPLNATFNGLAEVVFDQEFGTKAILDNVIGTFEREGRDAAVAAAKDFTTSYITKALKKVQPVTSTLKNSIEEMATQFSQNVIDWSTIDPSKDIMEGVADAGIIGGATGAGFSTIGGVSAGIFNSKQKTKLGEAAARRNDIVNDLDNPNLNEGVKDQLMDDLEKVNDKIAGISDEAESKLTVLPEKERTEAQELQTQITNIESSLQDESVSESTKEALNKKVESLQEKLDVLVGASEIMKDNDSESQIIKEGQEAENKLEADGDQVAYEQKIKELEKRAEQLPPVEAPVTEESTIKADLPTISGETVTTDVVKPAQAAGGTPEVTTSEGKPIKETGTSVSEPIVETEKETVKVSNEFQKLAHKDISSDELRSTLSNTTRETGRELTKDQAENRATKLKDALDFGIETVESAKSEFGEEYVSKTLNYLNESKGTMSLENRSLITIALQLDLEKQLLENPENRLTLEKQLSRVISETIKIQGTGARVAAFGRLRQIARVGYDINQVTDKFFSPQEIEARNKVVEAIHSTAAEINAEAEMQEQNPELTPDLEKAISEGVEAQVTEIYNKLPKSRKERADKAIAALDRIQKKLRSKTYDATIGVPVAIIDAGITTIKAAIRAGVSIADAVELGINKIKEKHGAWAKEAEFRKDMLDGFKDEGIDSDSKKLDSKVQSQVTKLTNEIESINEQIKAGVKDAKTNKDPLTSPEIEKLKAERQAKLQELEIIDPTPSETIKNALIEAGYGREITVTVNERDADGNIVKDSKGKNKKTKEKRSIIDWTKLAGEEGSVDNIRNKVGEYLKGKDYSEAEIFRLQEKFVDEYNELHKDIIEKSIAELQKRNTKQAPVDTKSSAKRLAELYNYGLFDKPEHAAEYDYLINKTLGVSKFGQEAFVEAKKLAQALSDLYSYKDAEGRKLPEIVLKEQLSRINHDISSLLTKVAFQESGAIKAALIFKDFMSIVHLNRLTSLKNAIQNVYSGRKQRLFTRIGYLTEGTSNKELRGIINDLSQNIYEDVVRHKGLGYGSLSQPGLTKIQIEEKLRNMSDSQLYQTVVSYAMGTSFLNAADSQHKSALTEGYFIHNTIKVLSDKSNPNRMSKEEALNFITEKYTGQSLEKAKETAKNIIDKINEKSGKKVLPDNEPAIRRFAQDIMKNSLLDGKKMSVESLEASYKSAYTAAGYDLGHESNNLISLGVGKINTLLDSKINELIRKKKYRQAALTIMIEVAQKNVLNPYVGGGMNWAVNTIQLSGMPTAGTLYNFVRSKSNSVDLSSEAGIKNLEKSLESSLVNKSSATRMIVGAMGSFLAYAALKTSGEEDDLAKWIKEHPWAKKYFQALSPLVISAIVAKKNEELGDYLGNLLNTRIDVSQDIRNAGKLLDAINDPTTKKKNIAKAAVGEYIGSKIEIPLIPWRFIKGGQEVGVGVYNVGQEIKGQPLVDLYAKSDPRSTSFTNGLLKGGFIDYMGLRPTDDIDEKKREISITRNEKKTVYELSDEQIAERESLIKEFNRLYKDRIYNALKRAGKKNEFIDDAIESGAKRYAKEKFLLKHIRQGKYDLKIIKEEKIGE